MKIRFNCGWTSGGESIGHVEFTLPTDGSSLANYAGVVEERALVEVHVPHRHASLEKGNTC